MLIGYNFIEHNSIVSVFHLGYSKYLVKSVNLEGLLGYYLFGLKIRLICIVYSFICIFGFVILLRFKLIFKSI